MQSWSSTFPWLTRMLATVVGIILGGYLIPAEQTISPSSPDHSSSSQISNNLNAESNNSTSPNHYKSMPKLFPERFTSVIEYNDLIRRDHPRAKNSNSYVEANSTTSSHEKAPVSFCLIGQPRALMYPEVYKSFYENALSTTQAPTAVFLVLDDSDTMTNGAKESRKVKRNEVSPNRNWTRWSDMIDLYSPVGILWWDTSTTAQVQQDYPKDKKRNTNNMFYSVFVKMEACYRMVRQYEEKHQITFRHIVQVRPDVMITRPLPPSRTWPINEISAVFQSEKFKYHPEPQIDMLTKFPATEKTLQYNFNIVPTHNGQAHRYYRMLLTTTVVQKNAGGSGAPLFAESVKQAKLKWSLVAIPYEIRRTKLFCDEVINNRGIPGLYMHRAWC